MFPGFILPETTVREAGSGPDIAVGSAVGSMLLVTLGLTRVIEQESLDLAIWGSADGLEWGAKPLAAFPQKFYCGTYQVMLDLSRTPDVKFLRVKWLVNRWGKGDPKPLFDFYVFAQDATRSMARSA